MHSDRTQRDKICGKLMSPVTVYRSPLGSFHLRMFFLSTFQKKKKWTELSSWMNCAGTCAFGAMSTSLKTAHMLVDQVSTQDTQHHRPPSPPPYPCTVFKYYTLITRMLTETSPKRIYAQIHFPFQAFTQIHFPLPQNQTTCTLLKLKS